MVSKEKFLNFIALVKKNKEAISALGNSLDSYSIRDLSIFSLFMSADKIAGNYLDMDEDYFYEDFWAMLYDGEIEIEIVENNELHSFTISNWEEFYDYYSFIPGQK